MNTVTVTMYVVVDGSGRECSELTRNFETAKSDWLRICLEKPAEFCHIETRAKEAEL